jgi:hypothetical protein
VSEPGAKTIDQLLWERLLRVVTYAGEANAHSGELLKMTSTAAVSLPKATVNATVGVICAGGETTIEAELGAVIYGGRFNGVATLRLTLNQYVIMQADGLNWRITAGPPGDIGPWPATGTERTFGTEYVPAVSNPVFVSLLLQNGGGIPMGSIGFPCPANTGWRTTAKNVTPTNAIIGGLVVGSFRCPEEPSKLISSYCPQ